MQLSIIIVNYKSLALLKQCLSSIEKTCTTFTDFEIIIVDNTSNDELKLIKQHTQKINNLNIESFYSGGNVGFGTANNIGARLAQGEVICFLNPDTILKEEIFLQCINEFKDKDNKTVGVQLISEKNQKELSFFFIRSYLTIFMTPLVRILNYFSFMIPGMITSGACLFTRKADFLNVGGFNSKMFLYNEESYLAKKYLKKFKNSKFIFRNDLSIIHLEKKNKANKILRKEYYKSTSLYYNYFQFNKTVIVMLYFFKDLFKIIKNPTDKKKQKFEETNFIKKYI